MSDDVGQLAELYDENGRLERRIARFNTHQRSLNKTAEKGALLDELQRNIDAIESLEVELNEGIHQ